MGCLFPSARRGSRRVPVRAGQCSGRMQGTADHTLYWGSNRASRERGGTAGPRESAGRLPHHTYLPDAAVPCSISMETVSASSCRTRRTGFLDFLGIRRGPARMAACPSPIDRHATAIISQRRQWMRMRFDCVATRRQWGGPGRELATTRLPLAGTPPQWMATRSSTTDTQCP